MSAEVDAVDNYPNADSTGAQWQQYYEGMLQHLSYLLSHHQVFQAVQYATTSIMGIFGNYTEDYQMGGQSKVEDVLTKLQDLRNRIQNDFNIYQSDTTNTWAAQDALNCYYGGQEYDSNGNPIIGPDGKPVVTEGIMKILEANRPTKEGGTGMFNDEFINGIKQEFNGGPDDGSASGPIFSKSGTDPTALMKYWDGLWASQDPTNPDSTQVVTNAFTSVSSDFSSQSSTVQSKIKYYEANDEQYKSMMHDLMTEIINEEKQPVTATQSAAS